MTIFLSIESQDFLLSWQRRVFIVTFFLNVVSLYCLLVKTPRNQPVIWIYLIFIQVILMLSSVYNDVFFVPIVLLPAPGIYCLGVLCTAGINPHILLGVYILHLCLVGGSIVACSFYRHQTVIPARSPLRIDERKSAVIQVLYVMAHGAIGTCYAAYPFEEEMNLSRYNVTWILGRGPHFIHMTGPNVRVWCAGLIGLLLFGFLVIVSFYTHMFSVINAAVKQSETAAKNIRHSLMILMFQLAVPVEAITIPGIVGAASMLVDFIPFEVALSAYCVIVLHPLLHSIILLSITPAYRQFIIGTIKRAIPGNVGSSAVQTHPTIMVNNKTTTLSRQE